MFGYICIEMSNFSVLTIVLMLGIIANIERLFEYSTLEARLMVHSEMEVINKIRNSRDPERALQIATDIILDHLKQRESSQSQSAVLQQEPCAVT